MCLPPLHLTLRIFNRIHALLLQTRETLNWTRNTSNSRKSCTRGRNRTTKNSSRSKSRTTGGWRNRRAQREISKSNRSTSKRRSKWNKDTRSSSKPCRTDSSRQAEISPSPIGNRSLSQEPECRRLSAAHRGSLLLFVSEAYRVYRFVDGELLKAFKGNNSLERRLFGHALGRVAAKALSSKSFQSRDRYGIRGLLGDARRSFWPITGRQV